MPPRADRAPATKCRGVTVSEKACCGCGDSKPHKEFLPSKFTPDGVTDSCRKCMFARAQRDREEREARKLEREAKKAAREKATGSTATKTCKSCRTAKTLDDFARHGRSHDGHRHTCRSCDAAARAKRRAEISLEDLAEARERRLVGNRRAVSKWQKQNNAAVRAKSLVRDALKSGVIAKPERCQIRGCKERGRLHAHHFSYEHPLQVLFTCLGHHKRIHAGDKLELAVGLPPSLLGIPQKETTA